MTSSSFQLELHLTVSSAASNAVELLSANSELSKAQIKQAMHKGAVWLSHQQHTRRLRRLKKTLQIDDQLHLYYHSDILASQPSAPRLIADYSSYSIWYKPYGVFCQGSKWGDHCTINRLVEQQTERPAFIVHRLDRATTGLIIIAHSKRSTAALAAMFAQRQVEKRYLAIVHGQYPATEQPVTINTPVEGRAATSHIVLREFNPTSQQSLLEVHIETGRKHQIRRHLSDSGFAIVGDRLYGSVLTDRTADATPPNLQLCCHSLRFVCPLTAEPIEHQLAEPLLPTL
jgi:tRNA pseudouridine32 synthase/23S rRNA pseudouridine746 synthase